jgi:two-component system phosphate regulon response regulator PhoB
MPRFAAQETGEQQPLHGGPQRRVLVVDDDPAIRRVVRLALEREGFAVADAPDGVHALEELRGAGADLVVLDVNLPNVGGFDVLNDIRSERGVPVIMLTGRDAEIDRVLGLELGADDYVVKPFSPRELASRVRAVLRRAQPDPGPCLDFGELRIDLSSREVLVRDRVVELTAREFDLLAFLASSPRHVFTRKELLEVVWHSAAEWQDPATVTEHIRRIRLKIEDDREVPRWIRTVRAAGYAFEP